MPPKYIDLTGQRFGDLSVIAYAGYQNPRLKVIYWKCLCSCGNIKNISGHSLRQGMTKSCGHLMGGLKHGHRRSKIGKTSSEYHSWQAMKSRILNPNDPDYPRYGGRGIIIYPEWIDSFEAFYAYMGPKPEGDFTIDRIDSNGNYWPGNVRWLSRSDQARNRRPKVYKTELDKAYREIARLKKFIELNMGVKFQEESK